MKKYGFAWWRRWLRENYPAPPTTKGRPYVAACLRIHHDPTFTVEITIADDYEICIACLAEEFAMGSGEQKEVPEGEVWDVILTRARRRRNKEMWAFRGRGE